MKLDDINDRFVIFFLSISLPIFFLIMVCFILFGAIIDKLSFDEAFEALQPIISVIIVYIGAILGFAFNLENKKILSKPSKSFEERGTIRALLSIILTGGFMLLLLAITLLLIFEIITFAEYKRMTFLFIWTLAGFVSFIIGKYFVQSNQTGNTIVERDVINITNAQVGAVGGEKPHVENNKFIQHIKEKIQSNPIKEQDIAQIQTMIDKISAQKDQVISQPIAIKAAYHLSEFLECIKQNNIEGQAQALSNWQGFVGELSLDVRKGLSLVADITTVSTPVLALLGLGQ